MFCCIHSLNFMVCTYSRSIAAVQQSQLFGNCCSCNQIAIRDKGTMKKAAKFDHGRKSKIMNIIEFLKRKCQESYAVPVWYVLMPWRWLIYLASSADQTPKKLVNDLIYFNRGRQKIKLDRSHRRMFCVHTNWRNDNDIDVLYSKKWLFKRLTRRSFLAKFTKPNKI